MSESDRRRINVAAAPETIEALRNIVDREGISVTEALRRLTLIGSWVYQAQKVRGEELLVQRGDAVERVVLL